MEIGTRRALVMVLVAVLAAVALLGGPGATRVADHACTAVVVCLGAPAPEADAPPTPCLLSPACGGGAALTLGLLLVGVAAVAFALPPPRPPVLHASPPSVPAPAAGTPRTLERPPR